MEPRRGRTGRVEVSWVGFSLSCASVVSQGVEIWTMEGSSAVPSSFFKNGWNHQKDVSGSPLQRRRPSLGQRTGAVPPAFCWVGAVLHQLRPVPLAVKSLSRSVESSLHAEGILGVLRPSNDGWGDVFAEGHAALQPPCPAPATPLTVASFYPPPGSLDASGDSNISNSSIFTVTR